MASFSHTHPFAYHAFPLTAARSIWSHGVLLGKDDLGAAGQARRTTAAVDRVLGFSKFVHLYLLPRGATPAMLPILGAQLQPAQEAVCPHALLVVPTAGLDDNACTICNWNIAVSRPGVPDGKKGGNWNRRTNPELIAEQWRAFRAITPDARRARGFWGELAVPVLAGPQIAANLRLVSRDPKRPPELLLRSPARVFAGATILAFSRADLTSLQQLGSPPDDAALAPAEFPNYDPDGDPLGPHRRHLNDYLAGRRDDAPPIDFDAIRCRR